jgi:hypothetical protein
MLAFLTRYLIGLLGTLILVAVAACSSSAGNQTAPGAGQDQMREFSQCMRAHGLPGFPDPDAQGRLRGAGHEQQGDPRYGAAFEACRSKLPGGGEHR